MYIENYLGVASSSSYKLSPIGVFMLEKKHRHVLADVSNAEASDVAHAATLLDPCLKKFQKKLADPTF